MCSPDRRTLEPPDWIGELASRHPFGEDDRLGTVNLIDDSARARAAALVTTGQSVSLARPLRGHDMDVTPDRPGFLHETWYVPVDNGMGWGLDHVVLNSHGLLNTHIDGLNHVAVNDTFYGGRPVEDAEQGSVDVLTRSGLLTRAVYVDIPTLRGTEWADSPVTGAEIDAALASAGISFESGDALCLDMGRDRFEAAVGHQLGHPETDWDAGGGLGSEGTRWVAEHGVSMLVWDMLDSREAKESFQTAHILTWAIGLMLVDNCDFGTLRRALGAGGSCVAGAIMIAPAVVEGANGVNVNPIVLR